MKKLVSAACLAAFWLTVPVVASAQDKKEEAKSPHTITGNVGFASEYRYRGISQTDGKPAGVVALRSLEGDAVAEMKRLYVRPTARGLGLGRKLAVSIIDEARKRRYGAIRLDTLPHLVEAIELYRVLGFAEIPPYNDNPLPGVRFYELKL